MWMRSVEEQTVECGFESHESKFWQYDRWCWWIAFLADWLSFTHTVNTFLSETSKDAKVAFDSKLAWKFWKKVLDVKCNKQRIGTKGNLKSSCWNACVMKRLVLSPTSDWECQMWMISVVGKNAVWKTSVSWVRVREHKSVHEMIVCQTWSS
jgi:hypothetical protein